MNQPWIFRFALTSSVAAHAWLLSAAPAASRVVERPRPTEMVMFTVAPKPSQPEPVVEPLPEEPEVAPPQPSQPLLPEPQVAATTEEPLEAAATEAPPELTGTTLTADGPGTFEAARGSGRERRGPVRTGSVSRAVEGPAQKAPLVEKPRTAGPEAVPLAELSRRPVPPPLGASLERNYPTEERRQGRAGEARVRALISPAGKIERVVISDQTSGAFGAACQKTLLGSKWSAPLDARGRAVPTWITYRCKFRIDD